MSGMVCYISQWIYQHRYRGPISPYPGGSGVEQSMDYMVSATRNGTLLFLSWAKLQVGRYNKIMKIPGGS